MTAQNSKRPTVTKQPSMLSEQKTNESSECGNARSEGAAIMMRTQCAQVRAGRRSLGLLGSLGKQVMGVRTLVHVRRIAAAAVVASLIAMGGLAPSASATPSAPACPDTV